ncbi:ATP-binding protein [Marinoscillum sp. 108]|uniref:ATP-binding protein n=1 Tax=Marinoscillum luteum TaxID=861051 RepID=A0ABW7N8H3_9BACT|nr:ATP-binding protein [Marinoscillum sp. 108]VXD18482.1 Serine/threonine-protein kinase RsbW [Marinoscillum sp. 108]
MNSIQIQIPSLSENIRIVESFIDNAKEKFSLNDDIYGNIMIAVTESVNNAIVHGNRKDSRKNVTLQLKVDDNILNFTITDEGEGFNFNQLPDPTSPENLDKPGGRGIFLMKHLCDEVSFQDEGRAVILTFYLN